MVDPETYTEDCLVIRSRKLGADVIITPCDCNNEFCMKVEFVFDDGSIARLFRDGNDDLSFMSLKEKK